jgi:hypothetical protein
MAMITYKCFTSIPLKVKNKKNQPLTKEISIEQIQVVISFLPCGKVPRHDSPLTKFFQEELMQLP